MAIDYSDPILVQKRLAIAHDVLAQLDQHKLTVEAGTFFDLRLSSIDLIKGGENLQKVLQEAQKPSCNVCALGALFVSMVGIHNEFYLDKGTYSKHSVYEELNVRIVPALPYLAQFFSRAQLRMIEIAFERGRGFFAVIAEDGDCPPVQALEIDEGDAVLFGAAYQLPDARLKAIFRNIIDNKGMFIPESHSRAEFEQYCEDTEVTDQAYHLERFGGEDDLDRRH